MSVLVTGATGLVGQRLLARLVDAGYACRALVRNEADLPAGVTGIRGDLTDPVTLGDAVRDVEAIVHLAAVFRHADDESIWRANLQGTVHLMEAAAQHARQARFIMASTTNIYDANAPRPSREDDPASPSHAYPASKLAAEQALVGSSLNWAILRLGFVYGDGDGHLEALPGLVNARPGWHPAHRMSLVHHRDVARATLMALQGAFDRQIVNVVDDAPTSIYELATLVGQDLLPSSEPLDNPWRLHADGSLIRRLGFVPGVRSVHQAVEEGLM